MLLKLFTTVKSTMLSIRSRMEDEDGVVAVEYITVLVLIALAIAAGALALGTAINNKLSSAATDVSSCCA